MSQIAKGEFPECKPLSIIANDTREKYFNDLLIDKTKDAQAFYNFGNCIVKTSIPRDSSSWSLEGHLASDIYLSMSELRSAKIIASEADDCKLITHDIYTTKIQNIFEMADPISCLKISNDESLIFAGLSSCHLLVIRAISGEILCNVKLQKVPISISYCDSERNLCVLDQSGITYRYSISIDGIPMLINTVKIAPQGYNCVGIQLLPSKLFLYSNVAQEYDFTTNSVTLSTNPNWGQISFGVLSNCKRYIVCAYETGSVICWNRKTGELTAGANLSFTPHKIAFSNSGEYFYALVKNEKLNTYQTKIIFPQILA